MIISFYRSMVVFVYGILLTFNKQTEHISWVQTFIKKITD